MAPQGTYSRVVAGFSVRTLTPRRLVFANITGTHVLEYAPRRQHRVHLHRPWSLSPTTIYTNNTATSSPPSLIVVNVNANKFFFFFFTSDAALNTSGKHMPNPRNQLPLQFNLHQQLPLSSSSTTTSPPELQSIFIFTLNQSFFLATISFTPASTADNFYASTGHGEFPC